MIRDRSRTCGSSGAMRQAAVGWDAPGLVTAAIVLALTGAAPTVGRAQQPAAASPLVFDSVIVVDVERGKLLPARRLVIVGNHIQTVDDAGAVRTPSRAQIVNARGKYRIPGLWDMHIHIMNQNDQSLDAVRGVASIMHPFYSPTA